MEYLVVIEKATDGSYSAYAPDLPGCVSCGDTLEETKMLIQEAMRLHLDSLRRTLYKLSYERSEQKGAWPCLSNH